MTEPLPEVIQVGALGIILLFTIEKIFNYFKSRKVNGVEEQRNDILNQLKLINENHLRCLEKTVREGNEKTVKAITDMHTDLAKLLGEVIGRLEK